MGKQNTDVLHLNDIINKVNVPAGHQLTYFPISGVVASSSVDKHGPLAVLDSSPETFWQPSDQVAGAHIELTTPNAYTCYGVDIKFKESQDKKFNIKVDVLDKANNRWLTMAVGESSLIDDNKYERFQAAQHFKSDTFRVIINSIFDVKTGHLYTQPKITQIRIFGLVPNEDVKKYKITKDDECPEGYGKDAESGLCVKSFPSQLIKPTKINAHSAVKFDEPEGNDPENLLTVNPNDKLTLKGNGSYIEYGLDQKDKIYAVYVHKLNNPTRQYTVTFQFYKGDDKQPFYSFIVDIPDTQDKYIHVLNEPLRADRFVLSVSENSEPSLFFSLLGLYMIGEPDAAKEEEPPVPKSCSIKQGGWGSVSDGKPEEWTVKNMTDKDKKGKFKGVGKDGKNVFHLCDSKEDAEAFIKRKIWESKQTKPPVEPPVEPPTTGNLIEGVKIPYATTGKVRTDDWHYNANDGLRIDYEKIPSDGSFVNNAMVVYASFKGKVTTDEERGFKWSWARHTGSGTLVNTYIVATKNGDGKSRVRFEKEHPSGYSTLFNGETGLGAKTGQVFGLMGIRQNIVDVSGKITGVLLELWEDQGGLVNGKPANQWKRLIHYVDTKLLITDYPRGIECTCRMDDDIGDKNIDVKKVLLAELKPSSK